MESYQTVYRGGMGEIIEKKSRFIAEVYPIESEEQAAQILEETRKKYWDARHHCWAYVLGRNPAAERMSDDGEPAGTAGKPILEVIRGRKLTDVLVIVIFWRNIAWNRWTGQGLYICGHRRTGT